MGVDASRFRPPDEEAKIEARRRLDNPRDAFVIVYPAEFSRRKNHDELLRALDRVRRDVPRALLLLCGTGALEEALRRTIDALSASRSCPVPGLVGRMEAVYAAADMAVSTSKSEGLPFNIVEAQLCALPVAASRIRGHTDLISDGETGWCYAPGDAAALAEVIRAIEGRPDKGRSVGMAARQSAQK